MSSDLLTDIGEGKTKKSGVNRNELLNRVVVE